MGLQRKLWVVPVFLAFLVTTVGGDSGNRPMASEEGVTVTRPVPFVVESLREVKALSPSRSRTVPGDRVIPFHRIPRPSSTGGAGYAYRLSLSLAPAGLLGPAQAPSPGAPVLDSSFAGLGNPTSYDIIPPDTMGAAGPNHLVSILNSDFGVFDKSTGLLPGSVVSLNGFWSSVWNLPPVVSSPPGTFDPKILYDQHSGRFVAVSLGGQSGTNSWMLVAVSSTSNPLDNWVKMKIDADLDNNAQQYYNWADFPGLGVDNANIYISANMFSNSDVYQYSKVWVIPKAQLLTDPPASSITWTEFRGPTGSDSTMQPAHTFGNPGVEYFIYEEAPNRLVVASIDNISGTPRWNTPASVIVDSYDYYSPLPGVPQLGDSRTIDPGDTRLLNAVYRNGSLWTTHHVANGGKIEVAWYRIDPLTGSVVAQGRVGDPSRWYYYPSIAVNQDNDVAIGFSGSSTTEYASAHYTAMKGTSGTMEPVSLLKSGEAPYYKTLWKPDNRWGDFSATVVDPSDNVTFWTLQEYAKPPSGATSQWGTWWGKFRAPSISAPTGLTATAISQTRIDLAWTDQSGDEQGFRIERRLAPAGDYSVIATLGPDNTSYVDNTGLAGGSTYRYRVQAYNASGGSYSNEAAATAQTPPPSPSGGGGGGCSVTTRPEEAGNLSALVTVSLLLSPLGILALRRRTRVRIVTREKRGSPGSSHS